MRTISGEFADAATGPGSPTTAGDRRLLGTLALITTVTAVVSSLGAPLVPEIAATFDVPLVSAQWALTATLLVGAVCAPLLGRWGSGPWRRPVMLGGLGAVLLGTVLSAISAAVGEGFGLMVAGRALQGIGLGLVPLALAVTRDSWVGEELSSIVALLSVTTVAGAGLGYPVTASVAEHLGLAGAYWFGTLLVACTLLAAWRDIPAASSDERPRVDLVGAGLLSVGMVGVLLAVSQGERWGWLSSVVLTLGFGGLLVVFAWARWTWRRAHPLVDLRLAVRPGVGGPNLVASCAGVGMYGLLTLVVLIVQSDGGGPTTGFGLGLGVSAAGLVLLPYAVLSVLGARVARAVAAWVGTQVLLPIGCTVFASSLLFLMLWHDALWQVLVAMGIGGLGSGFTFSSLAVLIVPRVPVAETGSAMAFNQLLRYLGFSVGSALSVALLDLFGADDQALRHTLAILAAVCFAAGLAVAVPAVTRGRPRARRRRPTP
ncbi:MFS transporter [Nocardioides sp. R-C-SC26]|uniref:MFS transporter n=1 Tax=Nocardioides sp. R-C-SC26 TaxID=2870414 RepID=UPI001E3253DA|nr:MFS transporter [Nocardioides sp. R-C-SC26]